MAIRRRYYQEFSSRNGDVYKLSLWDLDHPTTGSEQNAVWGWQASSDSDAQEIDVIYDSVEIRWDGDNQEVHQPILGSQLRFSVLATTDQHMGIVKALKHSSEFRIGVKLERYDYTSDTYVPYWYGVILPEAVVYDYSDLPCKIDINATDGLSTLRDRPFVDNNDALYDGHQTAQVQIGNCFKHLPHLALWDDQDSFFLECVDIFHESHATLDGSNSITSIESILNNTGCNVNIWYEKRSVSPPFFRNTDVRTTGSTSYDVISNWMTTLGLRLCHVNGSFLAVSPFSDRNNINSRLYSYDKRTMVVTAFQASSATLQDSNTTLLPDILDLTSNSKILVGSTRSYLHPLRAIFYKHLQGGAARLFPETNWVNIEGDFQQDDIAVNLLGQSFDVSQDFNVSFPLSNSNIIVPTSIPLRMVGTLQHWFRPGDTSDEDTAIGAQFEVRMMIKVGSFYLKQSVGLETNANLSNDSDFGRINKSGSDITTWKPLVINSDVSWTTDSSDRFSFPGFLRDVTTPSLDMLQYDAGDGNIVEYYPGFACRRHPDKPNEQKHDSVSRGNWLQAYETELDFTLPDLPTGNVQEQGVEITVQILMYKNDGTLTTVTDEVFPSNPTRPNGARIIKFNMFVGDGQDEGDAFYYAELDAKNGREMVVGGETLIASRVIEDYGEMGVITANTEYTHKWHSENNFVFGSGRRNLQVLAEEHIRLRGVAREAFNLRFLIEEEETALLHPLHTLKFTHDGGNTFMRPLNMTHALSEGLVIVEGYQVGRDTGSITEVNDSNKKKGVGTNIVGGTGITGTSPVFIPKNQAGTSLPGMTTAQVTKLSLISVNDGVIDGLTLEDGAIEVDKINPTPSKTFVTTQEQAQISTNATNIATALPAATAAKAKTDLITTDSEGITGFIHGDGITVLSTDSISEDVGRTFKTSAEQDKLDKITFNSGNTFLFNLDDERLKISGSKLVTDKITTTGTGGSTKITGITTTNGEFDVDDGRQKMSFLTSDSTGITQITVSSSVSVDLDDAGAFFAGGSGDLADRSGTVTGNRVLLIDANGGMDEVADGSSGQFLQTNGSGSYSFASAGGGWHGNTTLMRVMPTEFKGNDLGRANVIVRIEDDTSGKLGAAIDQATGAMFAINEIPVGYKATHVKVNASSTVTNGVEVLEYDTSDGDITSNTTGNTNTNLNITDISSTTTNAICIKVTPGSGVVLIYSADITITSV